MAGGSRARDDPTGRGHRLPDPVDGLPDGWELLAGPDEFDRATGVSLSAATADGSSATLHVWPALMMSGARWTRIEIGARPALPYPPHASVDGLEVASLAWQAPNGDWAVLDGVGELSSRLPEIADAITWVDAGTWAATSDESAEGQARPPDSSTSGPDEG